MNCNWTLQKYGSFAEGHTNRNVLREWNIVISHRHLVIIGTQMNGIARHLR